MYRIAPRRNCEKRTLGSPSASVNMSIVGLAPALRRLKVIRFHCDISSQQIGQLSGIVADCYTLEVAIWLQPGTTKASQGHLSTFIKISKSQAGDTRAFMP